MKPKIAMVTILSDNVPLLVQFYRDVLGFDVKLEQGEFVEFESEGVRFAVYPRPMMQEWTDDSSFKEPVSGHSFELAFPLDTPEGVDATYAEIVKRGAKPIKAPADMPWGQRTAFFADPDGNIHELFARLPKKQEND